MKRIIVDSALRYATYVQKNVAEFPSKQVYVTLLLLQECKCPTLPTM